MISKPDDFPQFWEEHFSEKSCELQRELTSQSTDAASSLSSRSNFSVRWGNFPTICPLQTVLGNCNCRNVPMLNNIGLSAYSQSNARTPVSDITKWVICFSFLFFFLCFCSIHVWPIDTTPYVCYSVPAFVAPLMPDISTPIEENQAADFLDVTDVGEIIAETTM